MLELPPYTNVEFVEPLQQQHQHGLDHSSAASSSSSSASASSSSLSHGDHLHHHHRLSPLSQPSPSGSSHNLLVGPNQKLTMRRKPETPKPELIDGQLYLYRIESFTNFGTITCTATNTYGQSGHCLYHILVAGGYYRSIRFNGGLLWSDRGLCLCVRTGCRLCLMNLYF